MGGTRRRSRTRHGNKAGESRFQEPVPIACGSCDPSPHAGGPVKPHWTVGFDHSSHTGTKGIFCIAEIFYIYIYIYFVCNEPFSINILTAKSWQHSGPPL